MAIKRSSFLISMTKDWTNPTINEFSLEFGCGIISTEDVAVARFHNGRRKTVICTRDYLSQRDETSSLNDPVSPNSSSTMRLSNMAAWKWKLYNALLTAGLCTMQISKLQMQIEGCTWSNTSVSVWGTSIWVIAGNIWKQRASDSLRCMTEAVLCHRGHTHRHTQKSKTILWSRVDIATNSRFNTIVTIVIWRQRLRRERPRVSELL